MRTQLDKIDIVESVKLRVVIIIMALFAICCLLFTYDAWANNIRVENVTLYKSDSQPAGTMDIKFGVIWDNSFSGTDANSQSYFDRAWVFVKYGTGSPTVWAHATLTTGGSLTAYSATTNTGISADGMGAFASPGTGQTVRWSYTTDGLAGTETVKARVMGIEMVYIPTGAFELGDGNATTESVNAFHVTDNTKVGTIGTTLVQNIKVDVNAYDDDQIEVTGIGIDGDGGLDTDNNGTIDNASFPTGYGAFYIMKYEATQGQYRDFLNMLTRAQQNARTGATVTTDAITNVYVMSNTSTLTYRSGIRCPASGNGTTNPITFGCDLDADGTFNESTDGEWAACNYLSWMDLAAFADWAGLRPMTELEFEKAARGGGVTDAATGCYAWGTAYIAASAYTLSDSGANNEDIAANYSTTANYGNCSYGTTDGSINGPLRSGIFAGNSANTGRVTAGASYYGVMELSGNLWERPVTVGNTTSGTIIGGRAFEGTHGDGTLTTLTGYEGNATNSDWPGYRTDYSTRGVYNAGGSGVRGGSWSWSASISRVSDRYYAARAYTNRGDGFGARCSRTSP